MLSLTRLVKRNDVFYFRMAIPRHLTTCLQRNEIKVSLRTNDPIVAKVRSRLLSNAFEMLFEEMKTMSDVTPQMLEEPIRTYFQACLNRSLEYSQILPADPLVYIGDEIAYLHRSLEKMREEQARQFFRECITNDAIELLKQVPQAPSHPSPEALQLACNVILRAKIENARILAAQLEGHYDETSPRDPLFVGMMATGMPPLSGEVTFEQRKPLLFSEAAELYCAFKGKNDWVAKTEADTRRVLALAQHAIGATRQVRQIVTDDVKAVRDLIAKLPPNYSKYKQNAERSLDSIIAGNGNGPSLSIKTQDKYFGLFKAFLHWAVDEGYLDKLPGGALRLLGLPDFPHETGDCLIHDHNSKPSSLHLCSPAVGQRKHAIRRAS